MQTLLNSNENPNRDSAIGLLRRNDSFGSDNEEYFDENNQSDEDDYENPENINFNHEIFVNTF